MSLWKRSKTNYVFLLFNDAIKRKQNVAKTKHDVAKVKKKSKDDRINVFVLMKLMIGRIGIYDVCSQIKNHFCKESVSCLSHAPCVCRLVNVAC